MFKKLALVLKRISIVLFLCMGFCTAFGQVTDPPPQNPNGDPDQVPITGIEILIGLGGLLGIKKIHDLRKKR